MQPASGVTDIDPIVPADMLSENVTEGCTLVLTPSIAGAGEVEVTRGGVVSAATAVVAETWVAIAGGVVETMLGPAIIIGPAPEHPARASSSSAGCSWWAMRAA